MDQPPSFEQRYLDLVAGRSRGPLATVTRGLLQVASLAYRAGLWLREAVYRSGLIKPLRVPARVVSVGNLTMGGTGKTPAVIWLAERERAAGRRVAVLIRGHGARSINGVNVVHDQQTRQLDVDGAGDEALLIANRLGNVPVLAGKDRRLTAAAACQTFGADLLVLDDGFQYRRLAVDEQIVLLDATRPWGEGGLFPAGTLRDPRSALRRAQQVWITRCDDPRAVDLAALAAEVRRLAPRAEVKLTRHAPTSLRNRAGRLALTELQGQQVVALAGIGNPEAFAATLRDLGAVVVREAYYPDHHRYTAAECALVAASSVPVVTTEKDAIRLNDWPTNGAPLWVLGIDLAPYTP